MNGLGVIFYPRLLRGRQRCYRHTRLSLREIYGFRASEGASSRGNQSRPRRRLFLFAAQIARAPTAASRWRGNFKLRVRAERGLRDLPAAHGGHGTYRVPTLAEFTDFSRMMAFLEARFALCS